MEKTKKQIMNDYRKLKKINKSKIRDGQRNKNFLINEDSILNSLPSGDFDQTKLVKSSFQKEEEVIEEEKIIEINNEDDNEEYEKFNDDYFKQETI